MIQLANSSGSITKSYSYDAFGVERDINSLDSNPFRYCGEYFDKETKTIYLRARYYDPTKGRFTQEDDPEYLLHNDPLSLNLYVYCINNPILFKDPSGNIGVMPDGSIYMAENDTEIDKQLLLYKIEYEKATNDKQRTEIAEKAAKLRQDTPKNEWHVSAEKSLGYYTVTDITQKLNDLMKYEAEIYKGFYGMHVTNIWTFYNLVRNKGPLDLKYLPEWQHEHFIYEGEVVDKDVPGNINYGFVGRVFGFSALVLIGGAGYAQIKAGTSSWDYYLTLGDDPRDTARVMQGMKIHWEWTWKGII